MKIKLGNYPELGMSVVLFVDNQFEGYSYIRDGKITRCHELKNWLKNHPMPEILAHAERLLIIKNI